VVFVAQAAAHELLGDGRRQVGDLATQLVARTPHVGVHLRLRGLDQALRLGARGVHQTLLLVGRVLQRLSANRRRLGVRRTEPRLVFLLLTRGLRTRRLRFVKRFLNRLRALGHLREKRLVEQPLEDQQQDDEVHELDDQRLVEADQAAALVPALRRRPRDTRRQQHQQAGDTRDGADPFPFTLIHSEVSSISRYPTKVCENYHATPLGVNRRAQSPERALTPPPTTTSPP